MFTKSQRQPTVLFVPPADPSGEYHKEEEECKKHFTTVNSRMKLGGNDLVIGRYSVLPMYRELEADIKYIGASMINTYKQHRYVADMKNWYEDLHELTFPTWFNIPYMPNDCGPVVLKGETNSRKDRWNTHMFAKDRTEASEVFMRLMDSWIGEEQTIYARKYVPLVTLATGINGQPITLEYRFFCAYGQILASGYYWSNYVDEVSDKLPASVPQEAVDLVQKTLGIIGDNINFVVVDVALSQTGRWYVVELNDGQMSGLSECDPKELYKNLKQQTWDKYFKAAS